MSFVENTMQNKTIHKAVTGFLGATLTGLGAAMADGRIGWPEVIAAVGLGLTTGGAVWRVPNALKPGEIRARRVDDDELEW